MGLWLTGQTINISDTGRTPHWSAILVDESTVEIENIHAKLDHTDSVALAAAGEYGHGRSQALAMLCVLAVFIPSFFMQGAQSLFVPLSLAVGFRHDLCMSCRARSCRSSRHGSCRHHHEETASTARILFRAPDRFAKVSSLIVRLRWAVVLAYLVSGRRHYLWISELGLKSFLGSAGRFQLCEGTRRDVSRRPEQT